MAHTVYEASIIQNSPLLGLAIHQGHYLRPHLKSLCVLPDRDRLREEDPYTEHFASALPNWVLAIRSRYEVDLNRPRNQAVYQTLDQSWGSVVWSNALPPSVVEASLAVYDLFYSSLEEAIAAMIATHGFVVVLDMHSYNHRRSGPDEAPACQEDNPDVNLGTAALAAHWRPVVDRLQSDLTGQTVGNRLLDVRENVKFKGGHLVQWLHSKWPDQVCAIAIEWKKFWMDEWSGQVHADQIWDIRRILRNCCPSLVATAQYSSPQALRSAATPAV